MKLDGTAKDCKKDFVQFGRDFLLFTSHKSKKRCGVIPPSGESGSMLLEDRKRREYIEATDKEMDIWISVRPTQERKELRLIVTPFKKSCSSDDNYYRKCPGTNKCIKRELFCDGIVNCDGLPKDEQEEFCMVNSSLGNVDVLPSIPIIILIVVFGIVGLMLLIFCVRCISQAIRGKPLEPGAEVERRALRDIRPTSPSHSSQAPEELLTLPGSNTNTGPSQPSAPLPLPFNPPSYSEVMGVQYKDDPPKYSEYPQYSTEQSQQVIEKNQ